MGLLNEGLDAPYRDTMYRCGLRDVFDSSELEAWQGMCAGSRDWIRMVRELRFRHRRTRHRISRHRRTRTRQEPTLRKLWQRIKGCGLSGAGRHLRHLYFRL